MNYFIAWVFLMRRHLKVDMLFWIVQLKMLHWEILNHNWCMHKRDWKLVSQAMLNCAQNKYQNKKTMFTNRCWQSSDNHLQQIETKILSYNAFNEINLDIVHSLLDDLELDAEETETCQSNNNFVSCSFCGAIRPKSTIHFLMLVNHYTLDFHTWSHNMSNLSLLESLIITPSFKHKSKTHLITSCIHLIHVFMVFSYIDVLDFINDTFTSLM